MLSVRLPELQPVANVLLRSSFLKAGSSDSVLWSGPVSPPAGAAGLRLHHLSRSTVSSFHLVVLLHLKLGFQLHGHGCASDITGFYPRTTWFNLLGAAAEPILAHQQHVCDTSSSVTSKSLEGQFKLTSSLPSPRTDAHVFFSSVTLFFLERGYLFKSYSNYFLCFYPLLSSLRACRELQWVQVLFTKLADCQQHPRENIKLPCYSWLMPA